MITSPSERIEKYTQNGWWENRTLHSLLRERTQQTPDLLAVADQPNRAELTGNQPHRLTFAELDSASDQLAAQLLAHGIKADDTLIAQLPNIAELVACYLAASKIGAIISPVAVQYGAHELRHIASVVNPAAFITITNFRDIPLAENARNWLGKTVPVLAFNESDDNALHLVNDFDRNLRERIDRHSSVHANDANRIITLCWTSGTTGTPKGVPRSHNMWAATARCCIEAGNYQSGDRLLNPFPLINMASVGAFLFPSVLLGCSLVLHHPLDPALYLGQLQSEKITFTIAPPALLNQLAKNEAMWNQFDFSNLRSVGSGSAPLAPWMVEIFDQSYGKPIVNFYGSNEGISLFCTPANSADATVRATLFPRLGSGVGNWQGHAAEVVRSKIIHTETGAEITEPGTTGELVFAGATIFDGYLGTNNSEVFTADGYFRTGDLVEICAEAPLFYRIAGRCKDIINRGGMKVSPAELDVLLEGLPGAAEAAVCAFADDALGEKICACIVTAAEAEPITLEELTSYLAEKGLAKFKWPERIEFFDALPRNPLNKVQRFMLQDQVAKRSEATP